MMITEVLEQELNKIEISPEAFSELIIRMLDYGVINRNESQVESLLYDRYLQCAELVEDYLSILQVNIQHDRKFCFIRVFPPGAIVPGMQTNEETPFNNGFRTRLSQQEVATILVLRVEYEKALKEGQVDESGCVILPLEGLLIALKNLLKRSLPDNLGERRTLFKHLKQLRLIKFNHESDLDSEDSWLSIQPGITSFVSEQALSHLYPEEITTPLENIDVL